MKLKTLQDVFEDELFDMYNAEVQLTKELPKMADKATSSDLEQAFRDHLQETEVQVERLEKIVDILGIKIEKEKCEAMSGLIKEAERLVKNTDKGPVMDAVLISAAQKVEHYEMASYGTLRELSKLLGYDKAVDLLEETYEEEKGADEKLTALAEAHINKDAMIRMAAE
jgi:ferritin-like metal-binding protein YciE